MIDNPALGPKLNSFSGGAGGVNFFAALLPKLVGLGFVVGTILFFFVFIIGAIQWITSGGDKNSLEAARAKITSGMIGLIVLFTSFAIIKLIEVFFGIDILALDIAGLKI